MIVDELHQPCTVRRALDGGQHGLRERFPIGGLRVIWECWHLDSRRFGGHFYSGLCFYFFFRCKVIQLAFRRGNGLLSLPFDDFTGIRVVHQFAFFHDHRLASVSDILNHRCLLHVHRQIFGDAANHGFLAHFHKVCEPRRIHICDFALIIALGIFQGGFVALRVVADFFDFQTGHVIPMETAVFEAGQGPEMRNRPALAFQARFVDERDFLREVDFERVVFADFLSDDVADFTGTAGKVNQPAIAGDKLHLHLLGFAIIERHQIALAKYAVRLKAQLAGRQHGHVKAFAGAF